MGFFGGNNRNKIIEIIKSTDKKTIDKRESQNIDDIVFIDDLQIFFGGGGEKFEDKSGMGLSGKIYTIGFDEIFGGTNPGSSPIEFLFFIKPNTKL